MISAIACVDANFGIGCKGELLAHIPDDMTFFKEMTVGKTVVVGRKTYESFPKRPLKNRLNIVVSSKANGHEPKEDGSVWMDMDSLKEWLERRKKTDDEVVVIGGSQIYKELLDCCDRVFLTKVDYAYENVDSYFPNLDKMENWEEVVSSDYQEYNGLKYRFCMYAKTKQIKRQR